MRRIRDFQPFMLAGITVGLCHLPFLFLVADGPQHLAQEWIGSLFLSAVAVGHLGWALHNIRCRAQNRPEAMWIGYLDEFRRKPMSANRAIWLPLLFTLGIGMVQASIYTA